MGDISLKGRGKATKDCAGRDPECKYSLETVDKPIRTAAWTRKEGKASSGGLNRKGIASYRAANPGSKLSMAVTTKPSKLKKVLNLQIDVSLFVLE
jgi:hypothetical protein